MDSSSRTEAARLAMAVMPALAAISTESGNGKKASEQARRPSTLCPRASALRSARRTASTPRLPRAESPAAPVARDTIAFTRLNVRVSATRNRRSRRLRLGGLPGGHRHPARELRRSGQRLREQPRKKTPPSGPAAREEDPAPRGARFLPASSPACRRGHDWRARPRPRGSRADRLQAASSAPVHPEDPPRTRDSASASRAMGIGPATVGATRRRRDSCLTTTAAALELVEERERASMSR